MEACPSPQLFQIIQISRSLSMVSRQNDIRSDCYVMWWTWKIEPSWWLKNNGWPSHYFLRDGSVYQVHTMLYIDDYEVETKEIFLLKFYTRKLLSNTGNYTRIFWWRIFQEWLKVKMYFKLSTTITGGNNINILRVSLISLLITTSFCLHNHKNCNLKI
jgi:hypothetical protein